MLESGKWAITVTELEPGDFHYTVLEAIADDGDLFVFRPTILSDDAHTSSVGAWIAGVCELVNSAAETISLPLADLTSGVSAPTGAEMREPSNATTRERADSAPETSQHL